MKKIEKILEDFAEYLAEYHGKNGLGFVCTSRMINEFMGLNQEISQPEMKSVCDRHHLEICDECMKNGSWTFVQPEKEVENNTEDRTVTKKQIEDFDKHMATNKQLNQISESN